MADDDSREIVLIGRQLQQRRLYGAAQLIFQLARERDEARSERDAALEMADIKPDVPDTPASFTVREVPELSSGLGDGIKQTQADIKPDAEQNKSLAPHARKSLLPTGLEEMARAMNLMNNDDYD